LQKSRLFGEFRLEDCTWGCEGGITLNADSTDFTQPTYFIPRIGPGNKTRDLAVGGNPDI
jgi:hypothetical protein